MANTVNLTFVGDSKSLEKSAKSASKAVEGLGKSATSASSDLAKSSKESTDLTGKIGKLGAGVTGMTDAVDSAGAALSAFSQLQSASKQRAAALARANQDVAQAQEDLNQALRDGKQAELDTLQAGQDLKQARLDQATATEAYNKAVREFGAGSDEAKQAQLDLSQAGIDVKQAQEDAAQATRDGKQANLDAKSAQLDLNDAMREAHPPDLESFSNTVQMFTPILSGLIGVVGLVTAGQWAWNAAQLASPTTWIILAIVALVAIIILIATKTTWFQQIWKQTWSGIKAIAGAVASWFSGPFVNFFTGAWSKVTGAAKAAWSFLSKIPGWTRSAFGKVASFISAPYRMAFNLIASAWNATVGRLHWTVPSWIPGIGGNSISVPKLPKFHTGGVVPGAPGQEVLAVLQAGETVTPASGGSGGPSSIVIELDGRELASWIMGAGRNGQLKGLAV